MHTFTVYGNYGELNVSAIDGVVVEYSPQEGEAPEYADIQQFDVDEWRSAWPNERLEDSRVDILDIGFWCGSNRSYCAPEKAYRGLNGT